MHQRPLIGVLQNQLKTFDRMVLASEGNHETLDMTMLHILTRLVILVVIIGCSIILSLHLDMEMEENIVTLSNSGTFIVS